jgi:hypothetical protein
MKMVASTGFEVSRGKRGPSAADSAFLAPISAIFRIRSTRLLHSEQLSSQHVHISESRSDLESMQVLRQTTVVGVAEAEDVLDHSDHVLDLGTHARLVAVLGFGGLIDTVAEAIAPVGAISGTRRHRVDGVWP